MTCRISSIRQEKPDPTQPSRKIDHLYQEKKSNLSFETLAGTEVDCADKDEFALVVVVVVVVVLVVVVDDDDDDVEFVDVGVDMLVGEKEFIPAARLVALSVVIYGFSFFV